MAKVEYRHQQHLGNVNKPVSDIVYGEMLATHLLTYVFQHTLFDWLKFTWDPPKVYRTHMI